VLSSFDDYPIHQASVPVAFSAGSDPNHYDRYFFNGYTKDESVYFALAMGLYPNRHVADASFSVVRHGRQISVHASRRAPLDRAEATTVGPIAVEVVRGLEELALTVDAAEHGIRARLVFVRRTAAFAEPHFLRRLDHRVQFDYTRMTQFGTWEGWIEIDGERIDLDHRDNWGSRDRSWGVRPVGERNAYGAPVGAPQFFWLWAPVNFDGFCTHFDVNEESDGSRWHHEAVEVPLGDGPVRSFARSPYRIRWGSGTRHATGFSLDLIAADDSVHRLELAPIMNFHMLGLGYGHPEWGHGVWKGELAVAAERWSLPVATPTAFEHLHVQALSRATLTRPDGTVERGLGILEQLAIGPHEPTGLRGLVEGAA
jgi:hypothetical protein